MIECGSGSSLLLEPAQRGWVVCEVLRQELESHKATQPSVFCFINHAHAADTKLLDDAVMRERLADQGIGALRNVSALLACER
jgi:hypothetical protein